MPHYKLALLGFGNVGRALARLLERKRTELIEKYDLEYTITGIATGSHGAAVDSGGLDTEAALNLVESGASLDSISEHPLRDSFDFIRRSGGDVLFENSPVNYQTGQPAVDHLRTALQLGMHAVTANKGPVVHAYSELTALAVKKNCKFYFESAVMDGAPVFALFREALPGANLKAFRGILNSTTNLVLTRMEGGESFEGAVSYAQSIGMTETDPSGDIDGWDAAVKVAALVTVLMGIPLKPDRVRRQGIRDLTLEDIAHAQDEGARWKLICSARREGDQVRASVAPELVPSDSPFYSVMGTSSVVQFESDMLGSLTIVEGDPSPETTAYGLLADFINALRN
jgi:homoserine dehydrogenase